MTDKAILLILDGWGLGKIPHADAIRQANTPIMDDLMRTYPHAELTTFGEEVGLPVGQMGNSEVGHMNIGAGRPVYQDLLRINRDITSGKFQTMPMLVDCFERARATGKKLHLIGLLSDGGVHAHINHLKALTDMAEAYGLERTYVHAFLDGRDTDPHGGKEYITDLLAHLHNQRTKLATVIGRYYAMDRDKRWERTKLAYDLLVNGTGEDSDNIVDTIQQHYDDGQTDEFVSPIVLDRQGLIENGDTVLFFNFRADRPRQLTSMLFLQSYNIGTQPLNLNFYTMSAYSADFIGVKVIYEKAPLLQTFGHLLENNHRTQLRMAETEKYPHVTYFFSGGQEAPFEGEERIMVNSPKVATYDLQPEMSAVELTDALLGHLAKHEPDFICLNFANTDMVGHTGVFSAAMKAAETVDVCVGRILASVLPKGYQVLIIADHGNCDFMINEDGTPNTAHSVNPVPCIYVGSDKTVKSLKNGALADVAPTLADLMKLPVTSLMEGKSLLCR